MKILVINGPNLNFLGLREPDIYGRRTYADLVEMMRAEAEQLGVAVELVQSLLDAVKAVGVPTVEVHISDPDTREEFRKVSYIRAACVASIKGHGLEGYLEALRLLAGKPTA